MSSDHLVKWFVWPDDAYCLSTEAHQFSYKSDDYLTVMAPEDGPPPYGEIVARLRAEARLPREGSWWRHRNGQRYIVVGIANKYTEHPDKYPVTVVYRGVNGKLWSRPASDWSRSMTEESL